MVGKRAPLGRAPGWGGGHGLFPPRCVGVLGTASGNSFLLAVSSVCNFFQQPNIKAAFVMVESHMQNSSGRSICTLPGCICINAHAAVCKQSSSDVVYQSLAIRECGRRVQSVLTFKMV